MLVIQRKMERERVERVFIRKEEYRGEIVIKIKIFIYNANILKIMMMWKIMRVLKVSVIYIYIYINKKYE